MRSIFRTLLLAVVISSSLSAQRPPRTQNGPEPAETTGQTHQILEAERVLRPEDRAELSKLGIRILSELGGRRYVVRAPRANGNVLRQSSGAIASLREIDGSEKLDRSARVRLLKSLRTVELTAIFHSDVEFETAREQIISSGASLKNPLQTRFDVIGGIGIVASSLEASALADADSVRHIAARPRHIESHNLRAATLSSVTPLFSAPYGLTGEGVDLAIFDVGQPDLNHPELVGRVEKQGGGPVAEHPTHVAGTMVAKGNNVEAKGMSPAARLFSFAVTDDWFDVKERNLAKLGLRSDNNSWGYVLGWNQTSGGEWEWYEDSRELFGSYIDLTAALDKIGKESGTLLVHSSGNDQNDFGPFGAPFTHKHVGEGTDNNTYCYSASGSGTDCTTPCTKCETTRHPSDGPFTSVGITASAKNVIAVGAVFNTKGIAGFSSVGPTLDGRIKPDLVAKGVGQFSSIPGTGYGVMQGTSMSSPVVAGIAGLLVQQYRMSMNGANPTTDILKAVMINGAEDLGQPGPDYTFGFGLVNAKAAVDAIRDDAGTGTRIRKASVTTGAIQEFRVAFSPGVKSRVTLNWLDPEGAFNAPASQPKVVNDLDLKLIDPSGAEVFPFVLDPAAPSVAAVRGVNIRDTVEMVEIAAPVSGDYRILVTGRSVPAGPQTFAVVTGGTLSAAALPCTDSFEPNNTSDSAFGRLVSGATIDPTLCAGGDLDFYRFTVEKAGEVVVTVTPTAPVRVTVTNDRGFSNTIEVSAGSTGRVTTTIAQSGFPANFIVRVEAVGTITTPVKYLVGATYPNDAPPRRRMSRR